MPSKPMTHEEIEHTKRVLNDGAFGEAFDCDDALRLVEELLAARSALTAAESRERGLREAVGCAQSLALAFQHMEPDHLWSTDECDALTDIIEALDRALAPSATEEKT